MRRRPGRVSGRQHLEERTKTQRNKGRPPGAPLFVRGHFCLRGAGLSGGRGRGCPPGAGDRRGGKGSGANLRGMIYNEEVKLHKKVTPRVIDIKNTIC